METKKITYKVRVLSDSSFEETRHMSWKGTLNQLLDEYGISHDVKPYIHYVGRREKLYRPTFCKDGVRHIIFIKVWY